MLDNVPHDRKVDIAEPCTSTLRNPTIWRSVAAPGAIHLRVRGGRTARGWFAARPGDRRRRCARRRRAPPEWRSAGCARRSAPRAGRATAPMAVQAAGGRSRMFRRAPASWRGGPGRSPGLAWRPIPAEDRLQVECFVSRPDLELNPDGRLAIEDQVTVAEHARAQVDRSPIEDDDVDGPAEAALEVGFQRRAGRRRWRAASRSAGRRRRYRCPRALCRVRPSRTDRQPPRHVAGPEKTR